MPRHSSPPTGTSPLASAWRGWRKRCPRCGSGPLMESYLTARDACPVCREPLRPERTDTPTLLCLALTLAVTAPLTWLVHRLWAPEALVLFTIFAVGGVALCLYLLPRLKGARLALAWARRD